MLPFRALLADDVISLRPFFGDGMPERNGGCGIEDMNCIVSVKSLYYVAVQGRTFSEASIATVSPESS